jgi:UDP:flavonoid glycosyltransferase YjiC (YdhE family)
MGKKIKRKIPRRRGVTSTEKGPTISKKGVKKVEISENFILQNKENIAIRKFKRELRRTRNSASYRIGNTIIKSIVEPWKIILLPFSLILLSWRLVGEKLGKMSPPFQEHVFDEGGVKQKSIVMFPTNGVGFGHFTRLLSIAKRINKIDPEVEIIFFTTMPTLHILKEQGDFTAYHIPGRSGFKEEINAKMWNRITEEFLSNVFEIHRPNMFIFDGVFPYRGMLNAIRPRKMEKIWVRRSMFKKSSSKIPLESLNYFNTIIRPSDSINLGKDDEYDPDILTCDPIRLLDLENLEDKDEVLSKLGIPDGALVVYVQLGAGNINNISSEIGMTIKALSDNENIYIVLGESMLGKRMKINHERMRIIRDYPNSRFFNAFDFAIMAAGYNSFHEAISFSLPTIFYPNMNTGKDDQYARAKIAEDAGAMVVIKQRRPNTIAAAIERLCDSNVRERMRKNSEKLQRENGAQQLAEYLVEKL